MAQLVICVIMRHQKWLLMKRFSCIKVYLIFYVVPFFFSFCIVIKLNLLSVSPKGPSSTSVWIPNYIVTGSCPIKAKHPLPRIWSKFHYLTKWTKMLKQLSFLKKITFLSVAILFYSANRTVFRCFFLMHNVVLDCSSMSNRDILNPTSKMDMTHFNTV